MSKRNTQPRRRGATPAAQTAVEFGQGACIVRAGPGAGKTQVLVERFARLCESGEDPARIQVLTFNTNAAEQIAERIAARIGAALPADPPAEATYHAFAYHLLGRFGRHIGYELPQRADEAVKWVLLCQTIEELRPAGIYVPTNPTARAASVAAVIQQAKQELVTPQAYEEWAVMALAQAAPVDVDEAERHLGVAQVYAGLQERLAAADLVDYDDMVMLAVRLLREVDQVREYTRRVKWLMVDEYQDTNRAQALMVREMVDPARPNVMVVADEDQAIYRFRGASRTNLEAFRGLFPDHTEISMLTNHRSTPQIVAVTQGVIDAAVGRDPKTMQSSRPSGAKVEVVECGDLEGQAVAIGERFIRLHDEGAGFADMMVLFRNHSDLACVSQAFDRLGIPHLYRGGRDYFASPEIKDLMMLLQALDDPANTQAVQRCLNLPAWRLSPPGVLAVKRAIRADPETPLVEVLAAGEMPGAGAADLERARHLAATLSELASRGLRESARRLFHDAYVAAAAGEMFQDMAGLSRDQAVANVRRFFQLLDAFREHVSQDLVGEAVAYLQLLERNGREHQAEFAASGVDAVSVMTIHAAKGLERAHVAVGGLNEGDLPSNRERRPLVTLPAGLGEPVGGTVDGQLEEERRLFYVALTRAKDSLLVTFSGAAGGGRGKAPSSFLSSVPKAEISFHREPRTFAAPVRASLPEEFRGGAIVVSQSDLEGFKRCPQQYMQLAVLCEPADDTREAWFGTAVHLVLRAVGERALGGAVADPSAAADLWSRQWERSKGMVGRTAALKDAGESMIRRYVASDLFRPGAIRHVELPVQIRDDPVGQFAIVVKNRIDRLEGTRVLRVVDYKTGMPRTAESLRYDVQVTCYAVGVAEQFGAERVEVEMQWLQDCTASLLEFGPDEIAAARRRLWGLAKRLREAHDSGIFPMSISDWNCPRCPVVHLCPQRAALAA